MFKFLHVADIHLGCHRYDLEERTKDFFRAWNDVVVKHAIPRKVDFVLIAGDFFHSRKVDPQGMNHAIIGLQSLKDAGIPTLAIEGNHDQRDAVSGYSWLRSLSQWGFMKLLEPKSQQSFTMVPWDEQAREGSYCDVAGARIFGSNWYGSSTNAAIPHLAEGLARSRGEGLFNILMLHSDVEGQLARPNMSGLSLSKLADLRSLVDYVALGHTHKRFEVENWAFNPGSLEACSVDEYREERGFYLVEVDDDHRFVAHHIRDYAQRPIVRLSVDVSGLAQPEDVRQVLINVVKGRDRYDSGSGGLAPIIEITLKGHLGFKNSLLEINALRDEAASLTDSLAVLMRNQTVPVEYAIAAGLDADAPRPMRERRIIEDLIARDSRFRENSEGLASLIIEVKRLVLGEESPSNILDTIQQRLAGEEGVTAVGNASAAVNTSDPENPTFSIVDGHIAL